MLYYGCVIDEHAHWFCDCLVTAMVTLYAENFQQKLSTMDGSIACAHLLSRKKRTYDAMGRIKKSRS